MSRNFGDILKNGKEIRNVTNTVCKSDQLPYFIMGVC